MPTRVKTPDGNIAEFPDGMSDDQIAQILKREYPPPQRTAAQGGKEMSWGDAMRREYPDGFDFNADPANRAVNLAGRYLTEGALGLPATLANVPAYAYNKGADLVQGEGNGYRFPDQNAAIGNMLTQMGEPEPQGAFERVVGDASRGVASLGTGLPGARSLAAVAESPQVKAIGESLAAVPGLQALAGATSGTAAGTARELGAPWWGQYAAGLAGGAIPFAATGFRNTPNPAALAETAAVAKVGKVMAPSGGTPATAAATLANESKPLTLMDMADDNSATRRLARGLVTQSGPASKQITQFLNDRAKNQGSRIMSDILGNLSSKTDVYGVADDLVKQRSVQSAPLWNAAMERPAVMTDRLRQFAESPELQSGFKRGITLARREALANGEAFDPNAYGIVDFHPDGSPKLGPVPTWRTWQAGKEGIDAMLDDMRDPRTGRIPNTKDANSLKNLQRALLKELDAVNPDYSAARAAWAGPSSAKQAMEMGENIFNLDPEEITSILARTDKSDIDFWKIGAARALQDKVKGAADNADLTKRVFGNETMRLQIEAAFGKDAAEKFAKAMRHEKSMAEASQFILGNSQTANKMEDLGGIGGLTPAGQVVNDAAFGFMTAGPKGAVLGPIVGAGKRYATNKIDARFAKMPPEQASVIAELLTSTGPQLDKKLGSISRGVVAQDAQKKTSRDELIRALLGSSVLQATNTAASLN